MKTANGVRRRQPIRLLLIEDSRDFAQAMVQWLGDQPGIELQGVAHTALDGIARARTARPEVVLMDVGLPDLDGFAATRLLKAQGLAGHVVIVTMTVGAAYGRMAADVGASAVLGKHEVVENLLPLLTSLVDRPSGSAEKAEGR